MTAFHTCHLEGSPQQIYEKVPYSSDVSKEQWLGQGYYFWTDSCFFAEAWGKNLSKYPKGYAISKFDIEIPANSFLDLVGDVVHQLKFEEQIREYLHKMHQIKLDKEQARSIPISKMLDHLRTEAKDKHQDGEVFFSYGAIRAADIASRTYSYPYLEADKGTGTLSHKLYLPTRQQLYIACEFTAYLKSKDLYKLYRSVNNRGKQNYQLMQMPVLRK